jgi:hypothetical protein
MMQSMHSPLTQELKKIIDQGNYIGVTSIISKFIRSFMYLHANPLYKDREILMRRVQMTNLE